MPQGKAYGALNELDKGARKTEQSSDKERSIPIQITSSKAMKKLRQGNGVEEAVASTGAPQKLKGVKFAKGVLKKDMIPDDTEGVTHADRDGVSTDKDDTRDHRMKPTASQQSALFGGQSFGQALGYVPKSYWGSAADLVKPDQTAIDQAAAIYYMK